MPIVHVKGSQPPGTRTDQALRAVATAVANATEGDVNGVWCTYSSAEIQTIGTTVPAQSDRILYVDLLLKPRGQHVGEAALGAAARAAAHAFEVKLEDVWARLIELESRKVFAGGELVP